MNEDVVEKERKNYLPTITDEAFENMMPLTDLPSKIEEFFNQPQSRELLEKLKDRPIYDEKWCEEEDLNYDLYQAAMEFETIDDTMNYHKFINESEVPKEWKDGWKPTQDKSKAASAMQTPAPSKSNKSKSKTASSKKAKKKAK